MARRDDAGKGGIYRCNGYNRTCKAHTCRGREGNSGVCCDRGCTGLPDGRRTRDTHCNIARSFRRDGANLAGACDAGNSGIGVRIHNADLAGGSCSDGLGNNVYRNLNSANPARGSGSGKNGNGVSCNNDRAYASGGRYAGQEGDYICRDRYRTGLAGGRYACKGDVHIFSTRGSDRPHLPSSRETGDWDANAYTGLNPIIT